MSRNASPDARIRDDEFALPDLDMPDPIGHRHTANPGVLWMAATEFYRSSTGVGASFRRIARYNVVAVAVLR